MKKSLVVRDLVLCLAAVSSGAAYAALPLHSQTRVMETHTYRVRFADLDLSRPDDVAVLYARLRRAAHIVCEPLPSNAPDDSRQYQSCIDTAITDAVRRVNRPLLSELFANRRNEPGRS